MDPEGSQWSTTDELLATLIEVVDRGDRWFFMAHTEKDTTPPDPIVIPRPGQASNGEAVDSDPEDSNRPATAAEMKAFFGGAVEYVPE
jgi:hypothetical protein